MSNTKMLIDATHPEETRVVVQRNGRVEEFDFESAARKLLRGNIYLAKVTRVEPSLQAAFVDYGGNRHGFLAFNEIHPDYYQIPVADRLALIEEEAAAEAELEAAADRRAEALERRSRGKGRRRASVRADGEADDQPHDASAETEADTSDENEDDDEASHIIDVEEDEHIEEIGGGDSDAKQAKSRKTRAAAIESADDVVVEEISPIDQEEQEIASRASDDEEYDDQEPPHRHHEAEDDEEPDSSDTVTAAEEDDKAVEATLAATSAENAETTLDGTISGGDTEETADESTSEDIGAADIHDDAPVRPRRRPRSYKIQEVIKRRQVILVQVVKEERGNKGAALTTYLSLAGRYTVLMPNTARGGGISRKITNPEDRKRLKSIANDLEVPEGMGLIIRTAGAARTKQEIKRDFEYLLRLWESVRELTLQSTAPSLVYEEGDLIKRSIRDLYNKEVEEVVVAGEEGYEEANAFMRMLMPSHAKNVVQYKSPTPLFTSYNVERQLNAMFLPQVTLRSGGYIVINQTEALVAIDVNSGKSTREFSIEETALATNLEAADEIARQLKLRDLAGLIVIDFIDMEEKRNNRAVERRLKEALRHDRARIQLGRISHFGLMEMSRQRLRTGVLEGSTSQCPHCQGTGIIRSTESIALAVLRGLEDAITAGANTPLVATTTPTVALYILNSKRAYITDMESRHGHSVTVIGSERIQGANFTVERGAATAQPSRRTERAAVNMDWGFEDDEDAPEVQTGEIETVNDDGNGHRRTRGDGDEEGTGRRRRRRRRGRGRGNRAERGDEADSTGSPFTADDSSQGGLSESNAIAFDDTGEAADVDGSTNGDGLQSADADETRSERTGRRRRRGRRGGRRSRESTNGKDVSAEHTDAAAGDDDSEGASGSTAEALFDDASSSDADDQPVEAASEANTDAARKRTDRIWDQPAEEIGTASETVTEARNDVATERPPVKEPAIMEPAASTAPITRRHDLGSSEPRLERVVVKPDESGALAADDGAPQPQRKGWWQRRFGGE